MNKGGPIIIIEDDSDDQEILNSVFESLDCKNEVIFFSDGKQALQYLTESEVEPFITFFPISICRNLAE
jgi:CheY-like chemotaxis protein